MIPLIRPTLPSIEIASKYLERSRASHQFTNFGPCFESATQRLNVITGGRHNLCLTSGTTAIEAAISMMGLKGKRIVLPDYTHTGTFLAVVRSGCLPRLSNCYDQTSYRTPWTLDLETLEKNLHEFDAMIVVSPFGYDVDMEKYDEFAEKHDKQLIYDFAGAWSIENWPITKNPVCYSFHSTKNFGVGEGGMLSVYTHDEWHLARMMINFGTLPDRTIMSDEGFNGKADELRCAMILAQIDEIELIHKKIENKRALLLFYQDQLPGVSCPPCGNPSLCVVSGLKGALLEQKSQDLGVVFKQYYPLLSGMNGLKLVECFKKSHPIYGDNCALPSDVSIAEAYKVVQAIKESGCLVAT